MSRPPYPPETKVRAFALFRAGRKQIEIARELGVSQQLICQWLNPKDRHPSGHRVRHQAERVTEADVMVLVKQVPPDTRDLTGVLAGDPLPGRSALDKRMGRG